MKTSIALLSVILLSVCLETAQAQFITPLPPIPEQGPSPLRFKTRRGFSIIPQSALGSGLDLCLDLFSKSKTDVKLTFGYYTAKNPWFYDQVNDVQFGQNSSITTLSDMQGFKGEVQVRKFLGTNSPESVGFSVGGFLQFRNISGTLNGSYYDSFLQRRVNLFKSTEANALFLGPIFNMDFLLNKFMYMQVGIGAGYVIPVGESDSDIFHITIINPYERSIGLKVNYAIGFYLD
jgi:hypothetical protein